MFTVESTLPLIVYFVYVPILFVIYLAQVFIVAVNKRKPQFSSSYYTLFLIQALTGLTTIIVTTVTFRLVLFPEVNSFYAYFPDNWIATGLYFLAYYLPACEEYTKICIALNRLSAIALYTRYERVWSRVVWLCLIFIIGMPFVTYYHLMDTHTAFYTFENGTTWGMVYDHTVRPWRSNRVSSFWLYLVCSITTLTLNLSTIVVIRCMSREKVSSIEVRLFLLGFSSFACGLPMTIQQFSYFSIKSSDELKAMTYRLPWLNDLKSLFPGILSLIFSTAIRNELRRRLTRETSIVSEIRRMSLETTIPLVLYGIYVPIIFLIYAVQVAIVIANKSKAHFRSSYFTLFIIEALTGLTTTIVITITHRLILFPEVNSFYADFPSNWITTALYFSSYYFPGCQEYSNIFTALNRLSAIALYSKYERIWKWLVWLCIPAIFGLPFISYYHILEPKAAFYTNNNGSYWFMDYDHSVRPWRSNRVSSFWLYLGCSITTLALNLSTIVAIRCISYEKVSSIEIRLFILGFCSFACGLPMTIQQFAYFYINADLDFRAMGYRLPWLYDLKLRRKPLI